MIHRTLITAALALATAPALAADHRLLPAADGDLVSPGLHAAKASVPLLVPGIERAPVQFAWALEHDKAVTTPSPHLAESREFYTEVDAAALAKGVDLTATAPGAVLRISPLGGAKAVGSGAVSLLREGKALPAAAIEHAATAEQMKAAGAEFADGTIAFRIAPQFGDGRFAVKAAGLSGRYLLHVYEPKSPYRATLATGADSGFAGGSVSATLSLASDKDGLVAEAVRGALSSPDGRVFDVAFTLEGNERAVAKVALPRDLPAMPGLWELHGFVSARSDNGATVLRDVKTSFAIAAPTARLAGTAEAKRDAAGIDFALPLDVAAPGRYELRGVLFGTAKDGRMVPVASTHSAAWLDESGTLALHVPAKLLGASVGAPWELRELALHDQSRLAKLETRSRALRLEPTTPGPAGPER